MVHGSSPAVVSNCASAHPVVLFDDRFRAQGMEYAHRHGRTCYVVSGSLEDSAREWEGAESVTFLGERRRFSFEFLRTASSLGVPFGIITAQDEHHLIRLLTATKPFRSIKVSCPMVRNIFAGEEDIEAMDAIRAADILVLGLHGDSLCASLGDAILCSRREEEQRAGGDIKLPTCIQDQRCFRKDRLGSEKNVRILRIEELSAEAVILNTCAGFTLSDGKYGNFAGLLPLRLLEEGVNVFVSSFLIKPSSTEDVHLYWALLQSHQSFAKVTWLFNQIRAMRLGADPSFVMLGDGSTRLDDANRPEEPIWKVEQADESKMVLKISKHSGDTICLSLDDEEHPLMAGYSAENIVGFVDAMVPATLSVHPAGDSHSLEIIIRFHDTFTSPFRVFVIPRSYSVAAADAQDQRARILPLAGIVRMTQKDRESLATLSEGIEQHAEAVSKVRGLSEFNGSKYLMMQIVTGQLQDQLDSFEALLSAAIRRISFSSDTHLILDDRNVRFVGWDQRPDTICPQCGNRLSVHLFLDRLGKRMHIMQTVCPRCEIIAVAVSASHELRLCADETVRPGEKLSIEIEITADTQLPFEGWMGTAIVGTSSWTEQHVALLKPDTVQRLALSAPSDLSSGLHYVRGWIVGLGGVAIAHRQFFVSRGSTL